MPAPVAVAQPLAVRRLPADQALDRDNVGLGTFALAEASVERSRLSAHAERFRNAMRYAQVMLVSLTF